MPLLSNTCLHHALVSRQLLLFNLLMSHVTQLHLAPQAFNLILRLVHLLISLGNNDVAEAFLVISLFSIHSPPLDLLVLEPFDPLVFPFVPHGVGSVWPVFHS